MTSASRTRPHCPVINLTSTVPLKNSLFCLRKLIWFIFGIVFDQIHTRSRARRQHDLREPPEDDDVTRGAFNVSYGVSLSKDLYCVFVNSPIAKLENVLGGGLFPFGTGVTRRAWWPRAQQSYTPEASGWGTQVLGDSRRFRGREQHLKRGFLAHIFERSQSKIQVEIGSGEEDPGRSEEIQWFSTF